MKTIEGDNRIDDSQPA